MLTNLAIRNIILIDRLDINFSAGFGVLTGETGAGKSILLGALGFVLGARSAAGLLRSGASQGDVTASFAVAGNNEITKILEEQGLSGDDELVLRRVIYADGKSKAFVNDSAVGLALLGNIAAHLVEIHGQHDQRGLLDNSNHREILDNFGQFTAELAAVQSNFGIYNSLQNELKELQLLASQALSEEDYLSYVLKELQELKPVADEETKLAEKRSYLMNAHKITGGISSASDLLASSQMAGTLARAQSMLYDAAKVETKLQPVIEALERAAIEVTEAAANLDQILSKIDRHGDSIETIEERLFALRAAARKYRVTAEELPAFLANVEQKLDVIKNKEIRLDNVTKQLVVAKENYLQTAQNLTKKRKEIATIFEQQVMAELAPLKMENTKFAVQFEQLPDSSWSAHGTDKISFLASTNPGTPLAPLIKIASGGELSRFMLAMKVVLSATKSVPTLIFDEVDTGIGGAVADAVGRRMELLGKKYQVLAVTHHPQVAARSSMHLKINKKVMGDVTLTNVFELNNEQKRDEIARMLAGETVTDEAIAAASKLMEMVG